MNTIALALAMLLASQPLASEEKTTRKEENNMESKKTLVAFFSRADENYAVGNIKKGNTHIIADMIAEQTGAETFHIETVTPYPADYSECTEVAQRELRSGARPEIKGDAAVEDYDVIFIGYPNWWGDMPMAVYTFIEKHDWNGKTVIPFCTHEGSGLSSTPGKLKNACKGAEVKEGLAVRGATAQNSQDQAKRSVNSWLSKLGF